MARSRVSSTLVNLLVLIALLSSQQSAVAAIASSEIKASTFEKLAQQPPPLPPIGPHFPKSSATLTPGQAATATPAPPAGPPFDWNKTDNYLVLGTDQRPGWTNWRTDTVIVVGLDRSLNRAAVFSIPRDLFVQIPGYGWGRINQVDYLGEQRGGVGGGPALVSQVLSNTLGISTKHWVRLRMDGFVSIVDAIGGVNVHLDCPFYEPIFNLTTQAWDYFTLPAGDSKLDGETAYWFVRLRYIETDIERGRRQRQFLWGLRNQVLSTNLITRFPALWSAFQQSFTTDLGVLDMLNLVSYGVGLEPQNVRASGLTLADLQNFTTDQGAAVLRIANPQHVRDVVNNVWRAPAMVDTNRQDATKCAPLPLGVKIDNMVVGPPPANLMNEDPLTQTLPLTQPTQ
ncbi:MAG: LCP family protein [Chloroflexi bacterium]|nr:LCP family protein [Chloroflexota bacterium]